MEKTDDFQVEIEHLFENIKDPLVFFFIFMKIWKKNIIKTEEQISKITIICRKANENDNFRYLLYNSNIFNNHPKIFFKKIDNIDGILGDEDRLETSFEQVDNNKLFKYIYI